MSMETDLADLRKEVQALRDRAEILDCIARHARGCDRHDADLLSGVYHDDSVDEHGAKRNSGPEYAAWANGVHAAAAENHLHNITTCGLEIDGDVAHAESYVLVAMLAPDRSTATLLNGRYLDRLERREGAWRIALRRSTLELMCTADASVMQASLFGELGYIRGTRDRDDPSYARPLSIDTPAVRW